MPMTFNRREIVGVKLLPIIEDLRYSPFPEAFLLLIAAMAVASGSVWLTFLHDS